MYKVQSVIFDKKKFSLHLSKEWLKKHGYKDKGVDDTDKFYRFRQFTPTSLKKQGYIEFKTKKLGKSGVEIIIAYKECKCGGKISNDDLHHFIHSSYTKGASYKDWNIDPELSDASVQVYWNGKDAVVVHRGSQDAQDWIENALTAVGIKQGQPRLEHSRDIQKKAEQKYGADNVITIGHSKGSRHAEEVGQKSREIYTLNKPVYPQDLLKKIPKKQTDIKTTFDPISFLRPLQRGNKYQHIPSKSFNIIKEHMPNVLKRISPNKMWGKGIMKTGGRKVKTGGGIIRTETQYKLAVSKLKRLLNESHLLDEEKDDLEETFNDVKKFYKENGDDLNFPDAMKFKVVLDLMIKKRIMTKQAKGLLSEYFAEEEEERYSSDFETFDEKTGKGRKTGGKPCYNNDAVVQPDEIPTRNPRTRRWREVYREAIRLNIEIRTRPDHQGNLTHINRFLAMVTELTNNFTGVGEKREISHLLLDAVGNPHLNVGDEIYQRLYHLYTIVHQIPEGAGISGRGRELGLSYH